MPAARQLGKEYPPPNEAQSIEDLWELQRTLMELVPNGTARRGQHAKSHGCVRATLSMLGEIPEWAQVGMFQAGRSYDTLVRFSSGFAADDRSPDIHGAALKLFGVPGTKLVDKEPDVATADLVMANHPTFFVPDVQTLFEFMSKKTEFDREGLDPPDVVARLIEVYPQIVPQFLAFVSSQPRSVLDIQYWSIGPYLLGEGNAVKYSLRPEHELNAGATVDSEHFLTEELSSRLDSDVTLHFSFALQRQMDADRDLIEDASVAWKSPWTTIAKLSIAPQQVIVDPDYAEHCSFTPWRVTADHRPLGGLNRARKTIYERSSTLRHSVNRMPMREPKTAN